MKFAVYTLTVLSLIGGLTLLSVNSNTVLPYQPLSIAEMQKTLGSGDCEEKVKVIAQSGKCATKSCYIITGIAPVEGFPIQHIGSAKNVAITYEACGGPESETKDCIKLNTTQDCALVLFYQGLMCNPAGYIGLLQGPTMKEVDEVDCDDGVGSSS